MQIDLSGKTALVTGSTKGIGRAIAEHLARAGARVLVHGRKLATARKVAQEISGRSIALSGDLSTALGVHELLAQLEGLGTIDILINNAGIFEPKHFLEILDEDWMRLFETNVMSGIRLSRALLPTMLKQNWGRIQFISSESALNIPEEMIHYGMSKTAQLAISRGIAELTKGTNVTVNAVLPGPTRSDGVVEFLNKMAGESKQSVEEIEQAFIQNHRPTSLIGRFATVDEVAAMVTYLASSQASATNGASIRVDGGVVKNII